MSIHTTYFKNATILGFYGIETAEEDQGKNLKYFFEKYNYSNELIEEVNKKLERYDSYCIFTDKGPLLIGIEKFQACCNIPGSEYKYTSNETEPTITGKIIDTVIMDENNNPNDDIDDAYNNDISFIVKTTDGTEVSMLVYNKNNNGYYNNDVVYSLIRNDNVIIEYSEL